LPALLPSPLKMNVSINQVVGSLLALGILGVGFGIQASETRSHFTGFSHLLTNLEIAEHCRRIRCPMG
jgi:hypothetical protein